MSATELSEAEKWRLSIWAGVAGSAALAWTLSVATADPDGVDRKRLLVGVGISLAAVGLAGGASVPGRKATWAALLFECSVGAGAISFGSVLATAFAEENHPAALGFWGVFSFAASVVVITPLFLCAFAVRAGLARVLQRG